MSGVIDKNGVQWEHCNICFDMVRLDNLGYEPPTKDYPHGRDVCIHCTNTVKGLLTKVQPAKGWKKRMGR